MADFSEEQGENFIHTYLDRLPDVDFIRAVVALEGAALLVDFQVVEDSLSSEMSARLTHQMAQLRLKERYRREVNTYISGHAVALHLCYNAGGKTGVIKFLVAQANHEAQRFHRNHWRPVLLKALAEHDAFCDQGFAEVIPVSREIIAGISGITDMA